MPILLLIDFQLDDECWSSVDSLYIATLTVYRFLAEFIQWIKQYQEKLETYLFLSSFWLIFVEMRLCRDHQNKIDYEKAD